MHVHGPVAAGCVGSAGASWLTAVLGGEQLAVHVPPHLRAAQQRGNAWGNKQQQNATKQSNLGRQSTAATNLRQRGTAAKPCHLWCPALQLPPPHLLLGPVQAVGVPVVGERGATRQLIVGGGVSVGGPLACKVQRPLVQGRGEGGRAGATWCKPVKVYCEPATPSMQLPLAPVPTCSDFMSFASSLRAHWARRQGGAHMSGRTLGMAPFYWPKCRRQPSVRRPSWLACTAASPVTNTFACARPQLT